MSTIVWLIAPLAWGAAAAPVAAAPSAAGPLLECTEAHALQGDWDALAARLAAGADCRDHRYPGGRERECRAPAGSRAYGLPLREFTLRDGPGGQRELRGVFAVGLEALHRAVEARHRTALEPQGAGASLADLGDGRRLRLDQREDGASELTCLDAGPAESAAGRAGADATRGALAGRLDFPTSPLPPMRVCAVPADAGSQAGGWCALTAEGERSYRIGGIPPGEYVVLAWPQRDNPNHYVIGHAAPLQNCLPNEPLCAGGALTRVYLHAGELRTGVDATQAFTDLPARFVPAPASR